jgi:hypothetical protein
MSRHSAGVWKGIFVSYNIRNMTDGCGSVHKPGDLLELQEFIILLVQKPEGKRPLGRPRRRWVDNIRVDLGEIGWGDVD